MDPAQAANALRKPQNGKDLAHSDTFAMNCCLRVRSRRFQLGDNASTTESACQCFSAAYTLPQTMVVKGCRIARV